MPPRTDSSKDHKMNKIILYHMKRMQVKLALYVYIYIIFNAPYHQKHSTVLPGCFRASIPKVYILHSTLYSQGFILFFIFLYSHDPAYIRLNKWYIYTIYIIIIEQQSLVYRSNLYQYNRGHILAYSGGGGIYILPQRVLVYTK